MNARHGAIIPRTARCYYFSHQCRIAAVSLSLLLCVPAASLLRPLVCCLPLTRPHALPLCPHSPVASANDGHNVLIPSPKT